MQSGLNTITEDEIDIDQAPWGAYRTCYRTTLPAVVTTVREWEQKLIGFNQARLRLARALGGPVSSMIWMQRHCVGGVKLVGGVELARHWRQPDEWGYRALRPKPRIPRGMRLVGPATIQAEHERLQGLWARHCPPPLDAGEVWQALGIHLASVSLWGGRFFSRGRAAYIALGFSHDRQEAQAADKPGQPSADWAQEAAAISVDEFLAARAETTN
jgi:hypothetical protein